MFKIYDPCFFKIVDFTPAYRNCTIFQKCHFPPVNKPSLWSVAAHTVERLCQASRTWMSINRTEVETLICDILPRGATVIF